MSLYGVAWRESGGVVRGSLLRGAKAGEWLVRGLGAPALSPSADSLTVSLPAEDFERWVAAYDSARARVDGMPLANLYGLAGGPAGPAWGVLRTLAQARGWNEQALHGLRLLQDQGAVPGIPALLQWDTSRRSWLGRRLASLSPVVPPPPGSPPPEATPPSSGLSGLGFLVVVGLVVLATRTALDPRVTRWGV